MDRLVWLGLGLLWSSVAFAQPPGGASDAEEGTAAEGAEAPTDAERDAEGRRLFVAGAEAFTGGHYEVALASFQAAYELTGRAALLYNIGLAHDRLRHDEEALDHFRAYIDQVENPPHREEVEARIQALEQAIAERRQREEELTSARAAAEAEAERARREAAEREAAAGSAGQGEEEEASYWWIGLVAGGVAAVALAVTLGFVLRDDGADYDQSDFGGVTFTLGGQ